MHDKGRFFQSIVGLGMLALCSMFAGCGLQNPDPTDGTEAIELMSYEVPPEYQDDLRGMLQSALGTGDDRLGRVINGPGGTLLVTAPARIQAGIEEILSREVDAPPASLPVTLTYWFLVGRPGDPSQTTPPFSVVGRTIPQLEPVLAQISNAEGATEFSLLEWVELTSVNQERAVTTSRFGRVEQRTARSGEQVVVDVQISLSGRELATGGFPLGIQSRVMLEPGQFLVLGRTGVDVQSRDVFGDSRGTDDWTLYYVMAADLDR